MSDSLEPCPFCGSNSVTAWRGSVVCNVCGATGPFGDPKHEAWNRRAADPEVDRMIACLVALGIGSATCTSETERQIQVQWQVDWDEATARVAELRDLHLSAERMAACLTILGLHPDRCIPDCATELYGGITRPWDREEVHRWDLSGFDVRLRSRVVRMSACLVALDLNPATCTVEEAEALEHQWQLNWDKAAAQASDLSSLRDLASRVARALAADARCWECWREAEDGHWPGCGRSLLLDECVAAGLLPTEEDDANV